MPDLDHKNGRINLASIIIMPKDVHFITEGKRVLTRRFIIPMCPISYINISAANAFSFVVPMCGIRDKGAKRRKREQNFFLFYMIGLQPFPYYHLDNTNTLALSNQLFHPQVSFCSLRCLFTQAVRYFGPIKDVSDVDHTRRVQG